MRVATYSRVSKGDQNSDIQLHHLREFCKLKGWDVLFEIVDDGYKGDSIDRPGLHTLNQLVWTREIDAVVIFKLDRVFRSLRDMILTLEDFDSHGVSFVAIRDNIDWTTPQGRFFTQILASFAEFEKAIIRERTIAGMQYAKSQGVKIGRPRKRDDIAILQAKIDGLTHRTIMKKLGCSMGQVQRALQ